MKKAILTAPIILFLLMAFSSAGFAEVNVSINVGVPPPVAIYGPPEVIVIPGSYVYAVPVVDDDVFFYNGYWWRQWRGNWYRSRSYRDGWVYYKNPPSAVTGVPSGWRDNYWNHRWEEWEWNYTHIPHRDLQKNWKGWEKNKHWEQPEYQQLREPYGRRHDDHGRGRDDDYGRGHDDDHGREHDDHDRGHGEGR